MNDSIIEFIRANIGTPYGRRTVEDAEARGFQVCSDVDPRYGSVYLSRVCTATSPEECATLKQLGRTCDTLHALSTPQGEN